MKRTGSKRTRNRNGDAALWLPKPFVEKAPIGGLSSAAFGRRSAAPERSDLPMNVQRPAGSGNESPSPQLGDAWDGRLEEWLGEIASDDASPRGIQDWSFPTDALRDEYIEGIGQRTDDEILDLLGRLVLGPGEYGWSGFFEGVRWALDLLPHSPMQAIDVINAYLAARWTRMPDGRIDGLLDALLVIRAHYLGVPATLEQKRLALYTITARQFEQFVEVIFKRMGYETELTASTRDGGRDVIATRSDPGAAESVRIECKRVQANVGVRRARELLGVVDADNATRGILVSAGGFTRDANRLAGSSPRLDLMTGADVTRRANEYLGAHWPTRIDSILGDQR